MVRVSLMLCLTFWAGTTCALDGSTPSNQIEEILVLGRATDQIGQASGASEGTVGGANLAIRPLLQVAELLEVVPGMVAVQHSGSGKANQYFMRGFNLDHGTDFSNHLDGVRINFRSHGHGQGYLDVNGLIPETIDRIDFRKGTYRSDLGDFSMAGSAFMHTIDKLDQSFVSLESGSYAWRRFAAGATLSMNQGQLTGIIEQKVYNSPWDLKEDLDHKSIWLKYLGNLENGTVRVTLSGYSAGWNPTEQIPESAIGTNLCGDEFCSLEPTSAGSTDRWILSGQFENDTWDSMLYAQYYEWEMSSNPTYDEQINQFDKRHTFGGQLQRHFQLNGRLDAMVGSEFQHDDVSRLGVNFYQRGRFLAANGDNAIKESSATLYAELTWEATDQLRLVPGLRGDFYRFDVSAGNAISASGQDTDSILSPKLTLAYTAADNLELYANWGYGFHSNDARSVIDSSDPVEGLVRGEGYETGFRFERNALKFSATWWRLNLDSELSFVGDSNSVEPKGGTRRDGIELVVFWHPLKWLALDAVYTESDARFKDAVSEGGKYVDGAIEKSGQFGITINEGLWALESEFTPALHGNLCASAGQF